MWTCTCSAPTVLLSPFCTSQSHSREVGCATVQWLFLQGPQPQQSPMVWQQRTGGWACRANLGRTGDIAMASSARMMTAPACTRSATTMAEGMRILTQRSADWIGCSLTHIVSPLRLARVCSLSFFIRNRAAIRYCPATSVQLCIPPSRLHHRCKQILNGMKSFECQQP